MKKMSGRIGENKLFLTNIFIIICGFILALTISLGVLNSIVRDDIETNTNTLFDGIYTSINDQLDRAAHITYIMSQDYLLQSLLEQEETLSEDEFEKTMANYLERMRKANGWEGAYLLSSDTNKYYTPDGIGKIVDPEHDEYDIWYKNFIDTGMDYGADLTYDQYNKKEYVIFIDRRMYIDDHLRSVLGCAMHLDDITDIMSNYSEKYDIDVCFTDTYGNTTLDENEINLGVAYYSRDYTEDMIKANHIYTDDGFIVRRYIPLLGMYLVVKNNQHYLSGRFIKLIITFIICSIIMILMLTLYNFKNFRHEKDILKRNVRTDFLTKISNLNGLQSSINMFIEEDGSKLIGATMFIIDIDRFKEVNDTFGHSRGDEVLRKIGKELSKTFRGGDIVGRLGGDEFMVFSPTLNIYENVAQKAKELNDALRFTVEEDGKSISISASIGIAIYPHDAENYEDLYKKSDKALYYVKEHGKDGYCIFSDLERQNS